MCICKKKFGWNFDLAFFCGSLMEVDSDPLEKGALDAD